MSELANVTDQLRILATDQAEWSQATFGADSDRGPIGPLRHLEKEACEAQQCPEDLEEYADCLLLILDAARRAGFGPMALVLAAQNKMAVNKTREWQRPTSDQPVEHVRSVADRPRHPNHQGLNHGVAADRDSADGRGVPRT
jgi:ParB family chromosome partitioning protein